MQNNRYCGNCGDYTPVSILKGTCVYLSKMNFAKRSPNEPHYVPIDGYCSHYYTKNEKI
jgi:hypothetical protein